jgi:CubicO group peptidase (beta-lactamase class C family)
MRYLQFNQQFFLCILLLICTLSFGQNSNISSVENDEFSSFGIELDSLRKSKHIPGLAVAVLKDQKVVWSEGFGASHFDTGDGTVFQKVTPDTPFWIASVTKTFLGLVFLQLEEEGKIDLDQKINEMPRWSDFCGWLSNSKIVFGKDLRCHEPISIKNVLNHTVNGKPGTRFLYNPIMYSRLSRYIEYVYGNPIDRAEQGQNTLAQLIEEKILSPVKMTRTMASQWQREKADVYFDMSQGYKYENGRYRAMFRPERHLAGGAGIVSSVNDLAKYDIAIDSGMLTSKAVKKTLFSPALDQDGASLPYAFGWYVQNYKGEKLLWHGGWDEEAGFTALYLKVPEKNMTLILLANSEGMWWGNPLDKATVHRSPFAKLFLDRFIFNTEVYE